MEKIYYFLFLSLLVAKGNCNHWTTNWWKEYVRKLPMQYNINNEPLTVCSTDPMTGWYRNGKCMTGKRDIGTHVVCAVMTQEFLDYTESRGNPLATRRGSFPGLKVGDRWCLCSLRWKEAEEAFKAPLVDISATQKKVLDDVDEGVLRSYALNEEVILV